MSLDSVRSYLAAYGKADSIIEFSVSSATVALAADALGIAGERIAKTLSFAAPQGCILVVAAGDARVDNRLFKEQFGLKPRMLDSEAVLRFTGHPVGGVCPFAVSDECAIYADVSLKRFDTVYPACGSSNSAIQLTPEELFAIARCVAWVDVCSAWRT